jgi:hypothetical protein
MNSVAITFATQPVCNAARAAHALRSDKMLGETVIVVFMNKAYPLSWTTAKAEYNIIYIVSGKLN